MATTQAPIEIGEYHLIIGRSVSDWMNMCQNRSGRFRSMISSGPPRMIAGAAIK
jgi:hypothetical protein